MAQVEDITDDEDFLELVNIVQEPERRQQIYRLRENQFEKWTMTDFLKRFRLSKQTVRYIIEQVAPFIISPTNRNNALTPEEMVLMALRFYATGSFLQVTGDFMGVDKSTASRHIWNVTRVLAGMYDRYIKLPSTVDEMRAISQNFYNISRFPKCIGALDCTHIRIISPGGNDAEIYRNRKSFFSMNVQAVCDAKCLFQDVVCRWPGSIHDTQIFANSSLRVKFERGDFLNNLLVVDGGYSVNKYMIPPLEQVTTRAENLFNEAQIRTRNPIERTFGIWKRRFPILAHGIRLNRNKIEGTVIATAILHNIATLSNEIEPPIDEEDEAAINLVNNIENNIQRNIAQNNRVRRLLIDEYFHGLL